MNVDTIIHRENPYVASRVADAASRRHVARDGSSLSYFVEREVLAPDGSFPFGEGYLYQQEVRERRAREWQSGKGRPDLVSAAGHKGTKSEQQDAFGAWRFEAAGYDAALVVAADGVSSSGQFAKRASRKAVEVFSAHLRRALRHAPKNEAKRHAFVETAIQQAAFAANFEVIRQVLFDQESDGQFDESDRKALRRMRGVDVPTGNLTPAKMMMVANQLDGVVEDYYDEGISALTTFAAALVVDNDVYTFSTGDAVVSLYRPTEPEGKRVIHLTHRDQMVVELYRDKADVSEYAQVYENVITRSLGSSVEVRGTLRRFPNLLEPGDRLISSSDGLGPRTYGGGLDREGIESVVESHEPEDLAQALVQAQLVDLDPYEEYQDNIGVAVLGVS